jgi:5-methylcytosine-specific restriction endonuclease McrA
MQKHVKNYMTFFGYGEQDFIKCEVCHHWGIETKANDIHHVIYRSQGGSDEIENLMALCRQHHDSAHNCQVTKEYLKEIHLKFMGV